MTTTATIAATALFAVPALAADGPRIESRFATGWVTEWAHETARYQRDLADGPFVPLVGNPDYGTAENAFGAARSGHVHAGQDIFASAGTPLLAVSDGVVAEAGSDGSQGNFVYLYDPRRERTYVYMHLIEPALVKSGDRVQAGERLGGLGCTGSCSGDHLHFEVRPGKGIAGKPLDPMPLLRDWESVGRLR